MTKIYKSRKIVALMISLVLVIPSCPTVSAQTTAVSETVLCETCGGSGKVDCEACENGYDEDGTECSVCAGEGEVECPACSGIGEVEVEYEICPECNGSGDCNICDGTGKIAVECDTCSGEGKIQSECETCGGIGTIAVECDVCEEGYVDCDICAGTGTVNCETCGGTGMIDEEECPDCENGQVACTNENCENGKVICEQCNGAGQVKQECEACGGTGIVEKKCETCDGTGEIIEKCGTCDGTGSCVKCDGSGKIYTTNDTSFAFETKQPESICVGDNYTNIAKSKNNTSGEVTYSSSDENIATVDKNGAVTAKNVGTVKITATIETDYIYSSEEVSYELTIEKATPEITEIQATSIVYGQKLGESSISGIAKVCDTTVAGTFEWKDSVGDTVPTVVEDSDNTEYTCIFTPDDTENYNSAECTVTVTVNKAEIENIVIEGYSGVYDGKSHKAATVTGTEEGDKIEYSYDGEEYTESVPQVTDVNDSTSIYVRVTRNGNYNEYNALALVEIQPTEIDGVEFTVLNTVYDGSKHAAVDIAGDGYREDDKVTYLYNGEKTDNLFFKEAGEYEFTVIISRDDSNYKETSYPETTSETFKAVIGKADLEITANDVTETYNDEEYGGNDVTVVGLAVGQSVDSINIDGKGTDAGTYTLTPDGVTVIDENGGDTTSNYNVSYHTGTLTINKRSVTVTATDVDTIYNAKPYGGEEYTVEGLVDGHEINVDITGTATAAGTYEGILVPSGIMITKEDGSETTQNYDITVNAGNLKITYLTLSDFSAAYAYSDADGADGWYNTAVIIYANEGYKICYTNDSADDFADALEYSEEGITNPKIAVMDITTGYTTDIMECNQVKTDTVIPEVYTIEYTTPVAYKILEAITFGIYNAPAYATLKAFDSNSGIAFISYIIEGESEYTKIAAENMEYDSESGIYSYKLEIPAEYEGQISYYAVDNSGLNSRLDAEDNGVIVDTTNPAFDSIVYNTTEYVNGQYFYNSDLTVDFHVDETYFYADYLSVDYDSLKAIDEDVDISITKDGEAYSGEYVKTLDEATNLISVSIPAKDNDGDFIVTASYSDPASNSAKIVSAALVIDTTAPVLSIEYSEPLQETDGTAYYNAAKPVNLVVTVVEHNFNAEYFTSLIKATDINGNEFTEVEEELVEYLKNADSWSQNGDTYTAKIALEDTDAIYTIDFSVKDNALNENVDFDEKEIVYDTVSPDAVTITYSEPVFTTLLDTASFYFYKETCEVTLTTKDSTSGVEYFTYSYDVNDEVNTANEGGSIERAAAVRDSQNADTYKYVFTIPAQFRGQITATATDMSGNTSTSVTGEDTIVTDTVSPEMEVSYPEPVNTVDSVDYYADNVTVTIKVTEENFIDGEYPDEVSDIAVSAIITDEDGNSSEKEYSVTDWSRTDNTDVWQGTLTLTDEGDYELTIKYTDKSENEATTYARTNLTIDKTVPVVSAEYEKEVQSANGIAYYNEGNPVNLVITVLEHNFNAEYFTSLIKATDICGNELMETEEALAEYLTNPDNWSRSGNIYIIKVPLEDADANYVIDYSIKDNALNISADADEKAVTYDSVSPDIEISTDTAIVYKILNTITFGIFNKLADYPATVTITSRDVTAGIQKIEYSSIATEDGIGTVQKTSVDVSDMNVLFDEEKQVVIYTFTIPAEYRNGLTATATDYSLLSATTANIKDVDDTVYNGIIADETAKNDLITISVDDAAEYASKDTFAENFDFHISIQDVNSGIGNVVVKINGEEVYVDSDGNSIADMYDADGDTLVEYIEFDVNTDEVSEASDGVYKLTVEAVDNASNKFSNNYEAYIDVYAPMITDFAFETSGKAYYGNSAYINGTSADVVKETDTYSYYFETNTYVTVYAYDYNKNGENCHTSGISDIDLIAINADGTTAKVSVVSGSFVQTTEDGIGYSQKTFLIQGPFKGDIYAIAYDYAGNCPTDQQTKGIVLSNYKQLLSSKYEGYVNPYDTVVEDATKHKNTSSIVITPNDKAVSTESYAYKYSYEGTAAKDAEMDYDASGKVPLYSSNAKFTLTVTDKYSGIKQISWKVIGQDNQDSGNNQEGTVTVSNGGKLTGDSKWTTVSTDSNLVTSMSREITVNNNSNDIVILVELTDRAGNTSYDYYVLGIDKTKPQIKVTETGTASNSKYFNTSRTVTIVVTERNFNASDFELTLTKNGTDISKSGNNLTWSDSKSDKNATDSTTHTAIITISDEGDYTLKAETVDRARNKNASPSYLGDAPNNFIIDKTSPTVNVSMTGSSKNEKYFFNESRTVTITVTDRNFNANAVSLVITKDGKSVSQSLKWTQDQTGSGRTNNTKSTATFTIDNEGDYTFEFTCTDLAKNKASNVSYATDDCQKFTIDKTAPVVVISQINYNSANNGRNSSGDRTDIPLTVTITDTNIGNVYSSNAITASEVSAVLNVAQLTKTGTDNSFAVSEKGRDKIVYTTSNITKDGVYTLDLTVQDCAGNKMTAITYNISDNKTGQYKVSDGNSNFFTFSVNRNGSTFSVDDNTLKLSETYYVQYVENDVVIVETNVDKLSGDDLIANIRITKDGEVVDASGYITVKNTSTSTLWQQYTYIIDKDFFEAEAQYVITVESSDSADNSSYSDLTMDGDTKIKFIVDRTAPTAMIAGVTTNASYADSYKHVTVTIYDDVLLSKIIIKLNGTEILSLTSDEFEDYFVDGQFIWEYDIPESKTAQSISVECYDAAGNSNVDEIDAPAGTEVTNFIISTDLGARIKFWIQNNVAWFVSICIAVVIIIGGLIWLILFKRRKKDEEEGEK